MAKPKLKTAEKAALITKLTTLLKKKFGSKVPKSNRNVLETYMFAACLEDNVDESASQAFATLLEAFHDLNEIRVSTLREIERPLSTLPEPEYRAMRIREGLHYVFEKHFAFDLDGLKKKNLDNASSDLAAIKESTPFMQLFTLQEGLGAHVIPIDGNSLSLLRWLGLCDEKAKAQSASDELKSAVRKSDGPLFAFLLRHAANDLNVIEELALDMGDEETSPAEQIKILGDILDGKRKPKKPPKKTKKASSKAATKKSAKKTSKKATKKAATKKPKAAPKKTAAKKKAAKTAKKKTAKKKATKKR